MSAEALFPRPPRLRVSRPIAGNRGGFETRPYKGLLARATRSGRIAAADADIALSEASAETPLPAAIAVAEAPAHRLAVEARFGELYVLFMRNLLLSVGALSFYRFWGRARNRRFSEASASQFRKTMRSARVRSREIHSWTDE